MCCRHCSGTDKESGNFFDPGENSDNEEGDAVPATDESVSTTPNRLPNPLSGMTHISADDGDHQTSVFTNYFHKAEEAKLAVLERHVKLTAEELKTNKDQTKRPARKGVCRSFQLGRCRFGASCRFAHSIPSQADDTVTEVSKPAPKFGLLPSAQMPFRVKPEEDEEEKKTRKHRSGVTDSLVPPKRAMRSLEQQRKDERPWTVMQH